MEVHQHSHPAHKKWSNYLWEFLMLFLAVFCGFLAENQREHIVEHQRAKIYASNLYKELQRDTAQFTDLIKWTETLTKKFDTVCVLQQDPNTTKGKLYYYSNFIGWTRYFSSECSTMEQLKYSGNLRILATAIALKISDYGRRIKSLEDDYSLFKQEYEIINGLRLKIFDGITSFTFFTRPDDAIFRDSVFHLTPPLINDDPKLMKEYLGWIKSESGFWKSNIKDHLKPLDSLANEIILMLKNEYRLTVHN